MLQFILNIEPVSVNQLYVNIPGQARRFLSAKGKEFKHKTQVAVVDTITNCQLDISEIIGCPLEVKVEVGLPTWLLKDGKTIRKKDVENMSKGLLDSVFAALQSLSSEIDDSQIWTLTLVKVYSDEPEVRVTIAPLDQTHLMSKFQ